MKLVIVCVLVMVAMAKAGSPRCFMGRCAQKCEEGTHIYALGCGQKLPEATCEEPNPVLEEGILCDYSACYCDSPTLRDTASGKCVQPSDCPQ